VWPVVAAALVVAAAVSWQPALHVYELDNDGFFAAPALLLLLCALGALVVAVGAQRASQHCRSVVAPVDDGIAHFGLLLRRLRRWQWAAAVLAVIVLHLAALSVLSLLFVGTFSLMIIVAITAASLIGCWRRLERLAVPIEALLHSTEAATEQMAPAATSTASASPWFRRDLSERVDPSAVIPGSSVAVVSATHFRTRVSAQTSRERRGWQFVVGIMTLVVAPILVDALSVAWLQWAPPATSDHIPLVHVVLPVLPAVFTVVTSLLTPLVLLGSRDVLGDRFIGRWTRLVVIALVGTAGGATALFLMLGGEGNAHLWGYALSLESFRVGDEDDIPYLVLTCIAAISRLMHGAALVAVANGVRRLVGPGTLSTIVVLLLAAQVVGWVATAPLASPAGWRALIDIVTTIPMLLAAVWSLPAFESRDDQRSATRR
jgi:hypothetical protein